MRFVEQIVIYFLCLESVCEEGPGICSHLLTLISLLIILITLPFSLCCVVQVVQVREKGWGWGVVKTFAGLN